MGKTGSTKQVTQKRDVRVEAEAKVKAKGASATQVGTPPRITDVLRPAPSFPARDDYSKARPGLSGITGGKEKLVFSLPSVIKYASESTLPADPREAGKQVAMKFKNKPNCKDAMHPMFEALKRVVG